jgi:hypothetical protein
MAEIRMDPVRRRSGGGAKWLWVALALLVLIGVGAWLVYSGTLDVGGVRGTRP